MKKSAIIKICKLGYISVSKKDTVMILVSTHMFARLTFPMTIFSGLHLASLHGELHFAHVCILPRAKTKQTVSNTITQKRFKQIASNLAHQSKPIACSSL